MDYFQKNAAFYGERQVRINMQSGKILFLVLIQFSPSVVFADWPLWHGGYVKNIRAFNKNGTPLCRVHSDNKCRSTSYLRRVEVFRLDHAESSLWRLDITSTGFKVRWKKKIGANTYELQWRQAKDIRLKITSKQIPPPGEKGKVYILEDLKTGRQPLAIAETYDSHRVGLEKSPRPNNAKFAMNWLYDEPKLNQGNDFIIEGRVGEYITFELVVAQKQSLGQGAPGKLTSNYGAFRFSTTTIRRGSFVYSTRNLINGHGFHDGVDIAASPGTTISFLPSQAILHQIS